MPFSVTALQLVNRVHRRRRMPDVGAFSETEDMATLNAVNHAIDSVMAEDRWDFNIRNDGQLRLRPKITGATLEAAAGNSQVIVRRTDGIDEGDIIGDFAWRLIPSGVANYADTSFRALRTTIPVGGQVLTVNLELEFPETVSLASGTACEIHVSEYTLPDTVDTIIRATYEEDPLTMEQVDPRIGYAEDFPRKHIECGPPRMISTGGFTVPTLASDADDPGPSLALNVWPIPDEAYVINYSYYYRHPVLESPEDRLIGVPPAVVDKIVELSTSDVKAFYDKDYNAIALGREAKRSLSDIYDTHGGNRTARKPWRGWEGGGRGGRLSPFSGKMLGQ